MMFAEKTVKIRHALVKLLAPKLYIDSLNMETLAVTVPRPMTLFMRDYFHRELVGVEIGTAKGDNALNLLRELPIKKLFLVDPYISYMLEGRQVSYADTEAEAWQRLGVFRQATFIKKTSDEAWKDLPWDLDFVYIDGNHSYNFVQRDIRNYWPLIREGGVLGGHDYTPYNANGVFQAVTEFVAEQGRLGFYAVFPDWWIVKQGESITNA